MLGYRDVRRGRRGRNGEGGRSRFPAQAAPGQRCPEHPLRRSVLGPGHRRRHQRSCPVQVLFRKGSPRWSWNRSRPATGSRSTSASASTANPARRRIWNGGSPRSSLTTRPAARSPNARPQPGPAATAEPPNDRTPSHHQFSRMNSACAEGALSPAKPQRVIHGHEALFGSSSAVQRLRRGRRPSREGFQLPRPATMDGWCPWQDSNLQPAV